MAAAAAITQVAGGVLNAYGQIQAGNTNQRLGEQEADLMDYRAKLVEEQGAFQAKELRNQGQKMQSQQRSSYAAQGVDVSTGTPAAIQEETAILSEQDAMRAKLNAAREAWGLRTQANVRRWQGDMGKYQSRLNAVGGLLGTGSSAAANYFGKT
jgi:hypothetical protein